MRVLQSFRALLLVLLTSTVCAGFALSHPVVKKTNAKPRAVAKSTKPAKPVPAVVAPTRAQEPSTRTEASLITIPAQEALRILARPPIAPLSPKQILLSPPRTQELARYDTIPARNAFHVLSYHDVFPSVEAKQAVGGDAAAITIESMVRHFSWLRDNGYTVVSMQQIIDARHSGKTLPNKAVLITFDDGYKSFHRHVMPVLRLFNYPAVLAVIGKWIDDPQSAVIEYEATRVAAPEFMTWEEIRDCLDSGLVELASHTFDLHHGHLGNPQGNKQPAAITRRYDANTARYESEREYVERVRSDLTKNSELLKQRVGVQPRIVVWPYGAYNETTQRVAVELGMPIGFTLDAGVNSDETSLAAIRRDLIDHDTENYDIAVGLRAREIRTQRVVTVDLIREFIDYNTSDERSLSSLLERVLSLKPSIVILKTNARVNGSNNNLSVLFPTSVAQVRMNLLNRVAWQLRTRAGVRVFIDDPAAGMNERDRVALLADLGRYNHFAGLVRGGDAQVSPALDAGVAAVVSNQPTLEFIHRVKFDVPCGKSLPSADATKTASVRNAVYSQWREAVALNHWVLLQVHADDRSSCTLKWWRALADIAATMPDWQQRTIIEIDNDIDGDTKEHVVRPLLDAYAAGFRHYGYANDDMRGDRPNANVAKRAISTETHPVKQR